MYLLSSEIVLWFLYAKLYPNFFKDFNTREYENVVVDVNLFFGKAQTSEIVCNCLSSKAIEKRKKSHPLKCIFICSFLFLRHLEFRNTYVSRIKFFTLGLIKNQLS